MDRKNNIPPVLKIISLTGLIIGRSMTEYELVGSPENLKPMVDEVNRGNWIKGWWSILALLQNPCIILGNRVLFSIYSSRYHKYYKDVQHPPVEVGRADKNASTGILAGLFKYILPFILIFTVLIIITILTQP